MVDISRFEEKGSSRNRKNYYLIMKFEMNSRSFEYLNNFEFIEKNEIFVDIDTEKNKIKTDSYIKVFSDCSKCKENVKIKYAAYLINIKKNEKFVCKSCNQKIVNSKRKGIKFLNSKRKGYKIINKEFKVDFKQIVKDKFGLIALNDELVRYDENFEANCEKHGVLKINYKNIQRTGCTKCNLDNKQSTQQKKFIEKSTIKHLDKYSYEKVKYVNNRTKVIVICKKHGEFKISPMNHLNGNGCESCSKLDITDFIERSKLAHGDKYIYDKSIYINDITKIEVICPTHGSFLQRPSSHFSGNGCPSCRWSLGEKKVSSFLEKNLIRFETQKRFPECKNKFQLKFDFYLTDLNILIEYDGIQHFMPVDYFGGAEAFEYQKKLRKIKEKFCEEQKIELVKISYLDDVNEILTNLLLSLSKNTHNNG